MSALPFSDVHAHPGARRAKVVVAEDYDDTRHMLRTLLERPALSAVPIVFLSGHAGAQHQTAALDAGCDEYVLKPFDLARFDTLLDRHLPGQGGVTKKGSPKHDTAGDESQHTE